VRSHGFLSVKADMQPQVVARALSRVEDEWNAQAGLFFECNSSATTSEELSECSAAPKAFKKACTTIVSAVVQASSGSKDDVQEYMDSVCSEEALAGWRAQRCKSLEMAITSAMSDDEYNNREHFDADHLCTGFWTHFSAEENVRLQAEKAEREAAEKKAADERAEAEKKAAEEGAEAEKKEAEERAAAEKKAQEEAAAEALRRTQEEEAAQAAAAKRQAEEEAAQQAQKSAKLQATAGNAERAVAEAEQKLAEVSKLTAAANVTANATANTTEPVASNASNVTVPAANASAPNATVANNQTA